MRRRILELLLVIVAVGTVAALRSPSPPITARPATPRPQVRWGTIPCTVLLENKQFKLRFDNPGDVDYLIWVGDGVGRYELVSAQAGKVVVAAGYVGCAACVVHECYHYRVLRVPAEGSASLDLGRIPATLKSLPREVPAEYLTYKPAPPNSPPRWRRPEPATAPGQESRVRRPILGGSN